MSMPIVVNGKANKNCVKSYPIINDAERVKKEHAEERRIMRLKQVREESKNLARKIRNDVAAEKDKQLRNLEAIKTQELNCWREHVMARKYHDYRSAIFAVGTAHAAASAENARLAEQKKSYNTFRKQAIARRCLKNTENKENVVGVGKRKIIQNVCTQTSPSPKAEKRKHEACKNCNKQKCQCALTDSSVTDDSNYKVPVPANKVHFKNNKTQTQSKGVALRKTPLVMHSETSDSCDNLSLTDFEVDDVHVQHNRKFTHVSRHSPKKKPISNTKTEKRNAETNSVSTLSTARTKVQVIAPPKSPSPQLSPPPKAEKRFTKISELLNKNVEKVADKVCLGVTHGLQTSPKRCPQSCDNRPHSSQTRGASSPGRRPQSPTGHRAQSPTGRRAQSPTGRRAQSPTGRRAQSPTGRRAQSPTGRRAQSPTGRRAQSPTGRKEQTPTCCRAQSPTGRRAQSPTGRRAQSPTGRRAQSPTDRRAQSPSGRRTHSPQPRIAHNYHKNCTDNLLKEQAKDSPNKIQTFGSKKSPQQKKSNTEIKSQKSVSPTSLSKQASNSAKSIKALSLAARATPASNNDNRSVNTVTCADKVQFYDYNNKYGKTYTQPVQNVQDHPVDCGNKKNAVQEAVLERCRQVQSCTDLARKREVAAERGQKALEREHIRRECNELTEKLDALMKQYPRIVPSDADFIAGHRFQDAAARKEEKMNVKVQEMLAQPTVITCPEVGSSKTRTASTDPSSINLNLGYQNRVEYEDKDISTDSCCSILLGYVNAQSKVIQKDIKGGTSDSPQKQAKLKRLLQRVEELRNELLRQIKDNPSTTDNNMQNVKNIIDSLSAVRNERDELANTNEKLFKREEKLKFQEATLDQKLYELNERQKQLGCQTKSEERVKIIETSGKNPLEIIIKVPGNEITEKTVIQTVAKGDGAKLTTKKRVRSAENLATQKDTVTTTRQNSYDSNSTAYRSLPKELPNNLDAMLKQLLQPKDSKAVKIEESNQTSCDQINPILAHYVQRLLGMSRKSVLELGVSSTDIETPQASVINTTNNNASTRTEESLISDDKLQEVEQFIANNRKFIGDLEQSLRQQANKAKSVNTNGTFDEIWQKRFSKKCLPKKTKTAQRTSGTKVIGNKAKPKQQHKTKTLPKVVKKSSVSTSSKNSSSECSPRKTPPIKSPTKRVVNKTPTNSPAQKTPTKRVQSQKSNKVIPYKTPTKTPNKVATNDRPKSPQEMQIERYAQLTDNCTQRIRELTELIKKVRLEKRKLLEVTLSSVSDAGRNSTEYLELPVMQQKHSSGHAASEPSVSTISNNDSTCGCNDPSSSSEQSKRKSMDKKDNIDYASSSANSPQRAAKVNTLDGSICFNDDSSTSEQPKRKSPTKAHANDCITRGSLATSPRNVGKVNKSLTKHKQIGASVDSGISMTSRPVTAQDVHTEHEPISCTSESSNTQHYARKQKPPPTLKRFSPLMVEGNEMVHELSTITEVETPGTSRVNYNCVAQKTQKPEQLISTSESSENSQNVACEDILPFTFPTFEEYVKEMHLDFTQIGEEQSFQLQKEYNEFIAVLKDARINHDLNYDEFPTLAAYLDTLTQIEQRYESQTADKSLDGLFTDIRTNKIKMQPFPSSHEYMKQRKTTNTPDSSMAKLLDTESIENISENASTFPTPSEEGSESLNIEEELRKRNILQSSFRRGPGPADSECVAESTRHEQDSTAVYKHLFANTESGIEKLSSSSSLPSSIQRTKQNLGMTNGKQTAGGKQSQIPFCSDSSDSFPTPHEKPHSNSSQNSREDKSHDLEGRPFDFREFFTRELMKQSSSSTDDSVRGMFLKSVIDSLSPNENACTCTGTGLTLDRQKTSTPVCASSQSLSQSSARSISSSTQLFSGESRLSAVHYNDDASAVHCVKHNAKHGSETSKRDKK